VPYPHSSGFEREPLGRAWRVGVPRATAATSTQAVPAVAPGAVWTPLIPATMPPKVVESFGRSSPIGRPGQPAELASAYVFLASQESSFVTGEVLAVTGGRPTT